MEHDMTQNTTDQQRMETAARSVSTKLQAFHEGLTTDEQQVLDMALRSAYASADTTTEDTSGYLAAFGAAFGPLAGAALAVPRGESFHEWATRVFGHNPFLFR
jgi:hypothetical protein